MADHAGEGDKSVPPENHDDRKHNKRMKWDQEQHKKFLEAVELVGVLAGPKMILEVMEVDGITVTQVGSHLQKYKLRLEKEAKELKEQNATEQRASLRSRSTNRGAASSSSPLDVTHTSDLYKKENSAASIASAIMEDYWMNLNRSASQENNLMQPNHSPYAQSNFLGKPVAIKRKGKEKISYQEANREALLLKNPAIPFIDLTEYSYCEQEHGATATAQVVNFPVTCSSWLSKPCGAMNKPTTRDGFWGSTKGKGIIKEEQDVQQAVVQNPSHAAAFVNPLDVLNKTSSGSSQLDVNNTSGLYEREISPDLIASTTTRNDWTPKFSSQYGSMLLHLNQSASQQNILMQPNYSPYTQSNFAKIPIGVQRRGMEKISNREANREALLENSTIPLIDLTEDSDYEQEHNNSATAAAQVVNFQVANSGWLDNPCSAMNKLASGDRSWDSTKSNVVIKEEQDVQEVAVQYPNATMFANPLDVLNKVSSVFSEQTVLTAELVEGSHSNMAAPLAGDPLQFSGDDLKMIGGYWDDKWNGMSNELDPVVHGSAKCALPSKNGTKCSIKNKQVGEISSSSNKNIGLDISVQSPIFEHGMTPFPEWNYFMDFGVPPFSQELNNAKSSSVLEVKDDIGGLKKMFCD